MKEQKKGDGARAGRLRAALRENLKRRKAQAKSRTASDVGAFSSEVGTGSREENASKQETGARF